MRGHRAKQYRKLMHQYALTFNFREPYQVLVDAQIVKDAAAFKYDLLAGLKRTLQGEIKPMITQCSMRHLYETKNQDLIRQAQTYERRRCNHHELEKPLEFGTCLHEVIDSKDNQTNKHRYIVATQDAHVRADMRRIPGVPLIYISRSVMILEPMAGATIKVRSRDEKEKLRSGIRGARHQVLGKRSREETDGDDSGGDTDGTHATKESSAPSKARTKRRGPKGPNPLSVKKPRRVESKTQIPRMDKSSELGLTNPNGTEKRKRKRKKKPKEDVLMTQASTAD